MSSMCSRQTLSQTQATGTRSVHYLCHTYISTLVCSFCTVVFYLGVICTPSVLSPSYAPFPQLSYPWNKHDLNLYWNQWQSNEKNFIRQKDMVPKPKAVYLGEPWFPPAQPVWAWLGHCASSLPMAGLSAGHWSPERLPGMATAATEKHK